MLDGVPLARIADEHGTPAWVYSATALRSRYRALARALSATGVAARIYYAMKANDTLAIVRLLAGLGSGADVVSGGEYRAARRAGIAASDIVFSGVGKTVDELRVAISDGVGQLNVESAEELAMVAAVAESLGVTAPVALRVNPDVDAGTHAKMTTGRADNKFGIPIAAAPALYTHAASLRGIRMVGVAVHIGSQILNLAPFRAAYARIAELVSWLRAQRLPIERIDCGGGLGICYHDELIPSASAFAVLIARTLGGFGLPLMLEPGRWLVGPAGVLLARVVLQKQAGEHRFVVLDTGMNDLLRPALYGAWHGIVPVDPARLLAPLSPADVVGPICETGDTFARSRPLPDLATGDTLAILDVGAYGSVMSSNYNLRPRAASLLVENGAVRLVRRRQVIEDLLDDTALLGL